MYEFRNRNAESVLNWFFRKNENLDQIVFYFLSKKNSTSARYFPLFEASNEIRIVYINGTLLPYSDFVMLKLYKFLLFALRYKINKYKIFHNISNPMITKSNYQVLHIDDPDYSLEEKIIISNWEQGVTQIGKTPIIICTNQYSMNYFQKFLVSKLLVVSQGFVYDPILEKNSEKTKNFSCVYSSPYIHIGNDKHAKHGTWGAELLIDKIIPGILDRDKNIEVHLVGDVGPDAKAKLDNFENVVCHGRVNFVHNMSIMSKCNIAIYPRDKDLYRSMTKIFSYIGAGLPIVTFDLVDSSVVKEKQLGLSVNTVDEFIEGVLLFKSNTKILNKYVKRINKIKNEYTWQSLAKKMDKELYKITAKK